MEYGRRLERIEAAKAEERMKAGKKDLSQNFGKGRTDDTVAEKLDIGSGEQYRKEKAIVDNKELLDPADFIN